MPRSSGSRIGNRMIAWAMLPRRVISSLVARRRCRIIGPSAPAGRSGRTTLHNCWPAAGRPAAGHVIAARDIIKYFVSVTSAEVGADDVTVSAAGMHQSASPFSVAPPPPRRSLMRRFYLRFDFDSTAVRLRSLRSQRRNTSLSADTLAAVTLTYLFI